MSETAKNYASQVESADNATDITNAIENAAHYVTRDLLHLKQTLDATESLKDMTDAEAKQYLKDVILPQIEGKSLRDVPAPYPVQLMFLTQKLLFNDGQTIDGLYGPQTKAAVRAFQEQHDDLDNDGVPGFYTISKLVEGTIVAPKTDTKKTTKATDKKWHAPLLSPEEGVVETKKPWEKAFDFDQFKLDKIQKNPEEVEYKDPDKIGIKAKNIVDLYHRSGKKYEAITAKYIEEYQKISTKEGQAKFKKLVEEGMYGERKWWEQIRDEAPQIREQIKKEEAKKAPQENKEKIPEIALRPELKELVDKMTGELDLTEKKVTNEDLAAVLKYAKQQGKEIQNLYLRNTEVTDISPLSSLENLKMLSLMETGVTDLRPLSSQKNLSHLGLNRTKVTNLSPLSNLKNLVNLNLDETGVADLSPLSDLKNLSHLDLQNTDVTDISPLASLGNLDVLDLEDTDITDLSPLGNCQKLRLLYVSKDQLPQEKINELYALNTTIDIQYFEGEKLETYPRPKTTETVSTADLSPELKNKVEAVRGGKMLDLEGQGITNKTLSQIVQYSIEKDIKIERINLQDNLNITDISVLDPLKGTLKGLLLRRAEITDVSALKDFKKLTMLGLQKTNVELTGLEPLSNNKALKYIWMAGTPYARDKQLSAEDQYAMENGKAQKYLKA